MTHEIDGSVLRVDFKSPYIGRKALNSNVLHQSNKCVFIFFIGLVINAILIDQQIDYNIIIH